MLIPRLQPGCGISNQRVIVTAKRNRPPTERAAMNREADDVVELIAHADHRSSRWNDFLIEFGRASICSYG